MTRDRERASEGITARGSDTEVAGKPGKRTLSEKLRPHDPAAVPVPKQERTAPGGARGESSALSSSAGIAALGAGGVATDAGVAAAGAMITPTRSWTTVATPGVSGGNECSPEGLSSKFTVVDGGATWGVNLTELITYGTVHVVPWPSLPSTMTTPNTANPVDGGNINNIPGHDNYWKFARDAMKSYSKTGASHHWHSSAASLAHEMTHLNTDWMVTCLGALWPAANVDINALTIPKSWARTAEGARPVLAAKVEARLAALQTALDAIWNAIPDTPGPGAGNGYAAGQAVLDKLIIAVEAYATAKGWMSQPTKSHH